MFLWDLRERDLFNRWRELDRLAGLSCETLSDAGAFTGAQTVPGRHPSQPDCTDERNSPRRHRSTTPETGELFDKARDCLARARPSPPPKPGKMPNAARSPAATRPGCLTSRSQETRASKTNRGGQR